MEFSEIFRVLLILFLILVSGFFSGSEAALFSLSFIQRQRLKRSAAFKGNLVDRLLTHPRRLIVTILVGNDLVNIASSVLAASLFISMLGTKQGKWVAIGVMTPLTLIFAEVVPKTIAMTHNERLAPLVSIPISLFEKIIGPIRWIFDRVGKMLIRIFGAEKHPEAGVIMEEEFLDMVDLSHRGGELRGMERDLIHNVFEFGDTRVSEVMVPLADVFCLPEDMKESDVLFHVKENHHSRIPVYRKERENIIGILYAKDLLKLGFEKLGSNGVILPKIARKPFFTPENKMIDELFYTLKQKRIHMAVCTDDDGKVTGLVTLEDLLEELFGEIYDEYDREEG